MKKAKQDSHHSKRKREARVGCYFEKLKPKLEHMKLMQEFKIWTNTSNVEKLSRNVTTLLLRNLLKLVRPLAGMKTNSSFEQHQPNRNKDFTISQILSKNKRDEEVTFPWAAKPGQTSRGQLFPTLLLH